MALTRKKITVRGKRKTYQRTVMVRAQTKALTHAHPIKRSLRQDGQPMRLGDFMRQHGKHYLKIAAAQGLAGGAGAYAGYHAHKKDRALGAAGGSLAGGMGVTAFAHRGGRLRQLNSDYRRLGALGQGAVVGMGTLANLAGHGLSIGAIHGARRGIQRLRKRS